MMLFLNNIFLHHIIENKVGGVKSFGGNFRILAAAMGISKMNRVWLGCDGIKPSQLKR
jgi:hypothetical protein